MSMRLLGIHILFFPTPIGVVILLLLQMPRALSFSADLRIGATRHSCLPRFFFSLSRCVFHCDREYEKIDFEVRDWMCPDGGSSNDVLFF